jgi:hypothetical protein
LRPLVNDGGRPERLRGPGDFDDANACPEGDAIRCFGLGGVKRLQTTTRLRRRSSGAIRTHSADDDDWQNDVLIRVRLELAASRLADFQMSLPESVPSGERRSDADLRRTEIGRPYFFNGASISVQCSSATRLRTPQRLQEPGHGPSASGKHASAITASQQRKGGGHSKIRRARS